MKIKSLFYLVLFSFITFTASPSFAQSESAEFLFSSNKSPIPAGENFELNINLDSGTTQVNAIDLKFEYPVQKISLVSLDTEISDFDIKADESITPGKITIIRGTVEPKSGITKIAKIQFTALEKIDLSELSYSKDSLVMSIDNENILQDSKVATINPNDVDLPDTNSDASNSLWERIKKANSNFWETLFAFITGLFNGNK